MHMTCNILDYGARISDLLQTAAIQAAIDDCFLQGGGTVIVPAGIYRIGGLRLRSHVTLLLQSGAMLEGSRDPEDYIGWLEDRVEPLDISEQGDITRRSANPFSRWNNALIRAYDATDIAIIGEPYSYIDGCNCYDPQGEENYRGPHGINMWNCRNVTLRGYTLRNTGNWAHAIFKSESVTIDNVTVYGGHDGIDIFLCEQVQITNCRLLTGDDAIAGFGSRYVRVRDCLLMSSCSSIRFGGTDVIFEYCRMESDTPFAFRGSCNQKQREYSLMPDDHCHHVTRNVFLYYCDERFGDLPYTPGNIIIRHCRLKGVRTLFVMNFGVHIWCRGRALTSITFEDCAAEGLECPSYIYGDPKEPITFTLRNVTLSRKKGLDTPTADLVLETSHHREIRLEGVKLVGYDQPKVITHTDGLLMSVDTTNFTVETAKLGDARANQ